MSLLVDSTFVTFPKIPRWNREIIVTEKIDGTNAQIYIPDVAPIVFRSGREVPFLVGSRNRWVLPENDNHGFAKWAYSNPELILSLGPGRHFGEWWGQGIQRGYGLKEKRFSLFNTTKWTTPPEGMYVVPVLYQGPMYWSVVDSVEDLIEDLRCSGSMAAPGYMKPEGIVIFHTASGHSYKVTLENDHIPKKEAIKQNII